MRAIFLGGNAQTIPTVYDEETLERIRENAHLEQTVYPSPEAARSGGAGDALAIFSTWGMPAASEEEIRTCLPNLKAVFYGAGSVHSFARPFLNCGVRVFSAWQANAVPVAEYAFAQIILALKGYFSVQARTRENRAEARALFARYPGCYAVRVGILGCGAIGRKLVEMLAQTDCEPLVFDPFTGEEALKRSNPRARKADMAEIFSTCMVVSNHLANLPATIGIIRREHLLSMPAYSTFINTGRGPQLNENDLFDALASDPTRTALLDVITEEAHSDDNRLNRLPNCYITPHIAGSAGRETFRMGRYMADAFDAWRKGEPCAYEVTVKMLDTMA